MIEQHEEQTFVEQVEADPRGRAELAIAEAQLRIEELLQEAVRLAGPIDYAKVAASLGVPAERAQRILEGEDELRFESFVRYLSVLGRKAEISLDAEPTGIVLVDHFEQAGSSSRGTSMIEWDRRITDIEVEALENPRYTGTTWNVSGMSFELDSRDSHGWKSYRRDAVSRGKHVDSVQKASLDA